MDDEGGERTAVVVQETERATALAALERAEVLPLGGRIEGRIWKRFAGEDVEGSSELRQKLRQTLRIEGHIGADGQPDGDDIMGIRKKLNEGTPLSELKDCFLLSERKRVMEKRITSVEAVRGVFAFNEFLKDHREVVDILASANIRAQRRIMEGLGVSNQKNNSGITHLEGTIESAKQGYEAGEETEYPIDVVFVSGHDFVKYGGGDQVLLAEHEMASLFPAAEALREGLDEAAKDYPELAEILTPEVVEAIILLQEKADVCHGKDEWPEKNAAKGGNPIEIDGVKVAEPFFGGFYVFPPGTKEIEVVTEEVAKQMTPREHVMLSEIKAGVGAPDKVDGIRPRSIEKYLNEMDPEKLFSYDSFAQMMSRYLFASFADNFRGVPRESVHGNSDYTTITRQESVLMFMLVMDSSRTEDIEVGGVEKTPWLWQGRSSTEDKSNGVPETKTFYSHSVPEQKGAKLFDQAMELGSEFSRMKAEVVQAEGEGRKELMLEHKIKLAILFSEFVGEVSSVHFRTAAENRVLAKYADEGKFRVMTALTDQISYVTNVWLS